MKFPLCREKRWLTFTHGGAAQRFGVRQESQAMAGVLGVFLLLFVGRSSPAEHITNSCVPTTATTQSPLPQKVSSCCAPHRARLECERGALAFVGGRNRFGPTPRAGTTRCGRAAARSPRPGWRAVARCFGARALRALSFRVVPSCRGTTPHSPRRRTARRASYTHCDGALSAFSRAAPPSNRCGPHCESARALAARTPGCALGCAAARLALAAAPAARWPAQRQYGVVHARHNLSPYPNRIPFFET